MLGPGFGFNPPEITRFKLDFKFDLPKPKGRINLSEFERI